MERPSYYCIITADVRYNNNLTDSEKLLFGEITALSNKNGYCSASNRYFGELYNCVRETISRRISHLKDEGLIEIEILKDGDKIIGRRIYPIDTKINRVLTEKSIGYPQNYQHPIDAKVIDNNTRNNNTSNNILCGDNLKFIENQEIGYQSFVKRFNELYGCNRRVTDEKRKQIRARLRTFTASEIEQAWVNRKSDDYLNGEGSKYLADWNAAMRNDEKIERYLEMGNNEINNKFKAPIV
jgi:hypothetical protein